MKDNSRLIEIFHDRATGQTTRNIDEAVQVLFTEGEVLIWDHHFTRRASEHMFMRFLDRLELEHFRGGTLKEQLIIDKSRLIVQLRK